MVLIIKLPVLMTLAGLNCKMRLTDQSCCAPPAICTNSHAPIQKKGFGQINPNMAPVLQA